MDVIATIELWAVVVNCNNHVHYLENTRMGINKKQFSIR